MGVRPNVFLNRSDDIPLHDLHEVNVIRQFEPLATHLLHEMDTPSGAITLIVFVVPYTLQQFHTYCNTKILSLRNNFPYPPRIIANSFPIREPISVSQEHCRSGQIRLENLRERLFRADYRPEVILNYLPTATYAGRAIGHRTRETVALYRGPVIFLKQPHGRQPNIGGLYTEFFRRNLGIPPGYIDCSRPPSRTVESKSHASADAEATAEQAAVAVMKASLCESFVLFCS